MFDKPIVRKPATVLSHDDIAEEKLPTQLVAPMVKQVHANDPVPVTVVSGVAGLAKLPTAGAISVSDLKLLDLFVKNAEIFGVQPVSLLGYPEAEYSAEWEQVMWSTDKVAYAELVTELVAVERLESAMKDQAGSRQKPERRQQELVRDRRKHFSDVQAWSAEGESLEPLSVSEDDDAADHGA